MGLGWAGLSWAGLGWWARLVPLWLHEVGVPCATCNTRPFVQGMRCKQGVVLLAWVVLTPAQVFMPCAQVPTTGSRLRSDRARCR